MFRGVSAFPLTPLSGGQFDEQAFGKVAAPALPFPLQTIGGEPREALARIINEYNLS